MSDQEEYNDVRDNIYTCKNTKVEVRSQNLGEPEPSPFFQAVFRLTKIKLTQGQLVSIMAAGRNPILRCVGFVYTRFGLSPDLFMDYLEPHLLDEEEFIPDNDHPDDKETIG